MTNSTPRTLSNRIVLGMRSVTFSVRGDGQKVIFEALAESSAAADVEDVSSIGVTAVDFANVSWANITLFERWSSTLSTR